MQFKLGLNRYHFKCQKCHGTLSIPVASIAHTGGVAGMMIGAGASKNLLVESEGRSESPLIVGMEYQPGTLRAAANANRKPEQPIRRIEPEPVYACPSCNGTVSKTDMECPHCHTVFEEV
jgi:hypothetical protein